MREERIEPVGVPARVTWVRSRGWALLRGVKGYDYYRKTNPELAANTWRTLLEVLAEADAEDG